MRFLVLMAACLSSCSVLFPDRTAPKSGDYDVKAPPSPWTKIPVGEDPDSVDALKADMAYEDPQSGSVISLNSLCRKYSSASLEQLTNNLIRGIEERDVVEQKNITVDGAEALDSLFEGVVDRVPVKVHTIVLVKDRCTFDFIHVTVKSRENKSNKEHFDNFVKSFRTK